MTTFSRLNGSVTPERLTTARTASSTVVNRRLHLAHERRRGITCPSSSSRESTTRESEWRQNGQRIPVHPSWHASLPLRAARTLVIILWMNGGWSVDNWAQ